MPRVKANPDAEVQNLNLRATEALQRARQAKIVLAMRCRPSLVIDPLWEKLSSLGLSDEMLTTPAKEGAQSRQKAAVAERKTKAAHERTIKVEQLKMEIGVSEENGVAEAFEPIGDKVETLEGLTVTQIRDRLLPAIDDMILSGANFRALKDKHATSKANLIKYITFCTGYHSDYPLAGKHRCFLKLMESLLAAAAAHGGRSSLIRLPMDWPEDGIYVLVGEGFNGDGSVDVKHKFSGDTINVEMKDLPKSKGWSDLLIDCNWSEARACLVSKSLPSTPFVFGAKFKQQIIELDEADTAQGGNFVSPAKRVAAFSSPWRKRYKGQSGLPSGRSNGAGEVAALGSGNGSEVHQQLSGLQSGSAGGGAGEMQDGEPPALRFEGRAKQELGVEGGGGSSSSGRAAPAEGALAAPTPGAAAPPSDLDESQVLPPMVTPKIRTEAIKGEDSPTNPNGLVMPPGDD